MGTRPGASLQNGKSAEGAAQPWKLDRPYRALCRETLNTQGVALAGLGRALGAMKRENKDQDVPSSLLGRVVGASKMRANCRRYPADWPTPFLCTA